MTPWGNTTKRRLEMTFGNPAIMSWLIQDVDPWLCVTAFQRFCPFRLLKSYIRLIRFCLVCAASIPIWKMRVTLNRMSYRNCNTLSEEPVSPGASVHHLVVYCNRGARYAFKRPYLNGRGTNQKSPLYSKGYMVGKKTPQRPWWYEGLSSCCHPCLLEVTGCAKRYLLRCWPAWSLIFWAKSLNQTQFN